MKFQICSPDDLKWPIPSLQNLVPLKGEWDTQSLLGVLSAILSFFDIPVHVERMLPLIFWLGVSLRGSPINMKLMKWARIQFLLCKRFPQSFSTNLVDLWEVQGVPVEENNVDWSCSLIVRETSMTLLLFSTTSGHVLVRKVAVS